MQQDLCSIEAVIQSQAKRRPDAVALIDGDHKFTFKDIERRGRRLSAELRARSVRSGDRIGFFAKNCVELFILLYAARKIGAILCPINYRLGRDEIAYILSDARPKLCLVAEEYAELFQGPPGKSDYLLVSFFKPGEGNVICSPDQTADNADRLLDGEGSSNSQEPVDILLLYTSGTTGKPKGVLINSDNYRAMLQNFPNVPGFSFSSHSVVASTMPLFHIAGINVGMAALSQNCTLILYPAFNAVELLQDFSLRRINYAFLAPAMIVDLVNSADAATADFSSLRCISYGASTIPSAVLRHARQLMGCDFAQLYGMTESAGAGTYLPPKAHDLPDKAGSCGLAWPQMELKIADAQGNDLSRGNVGELYMKGPYITSGYFNNAEASSEALTDGWLRTGDAACIDADGYVFIRDRIKDLIISGGENISPVEVENAIAGCPGVADVAVVGVLSRKWGEEVKAVVVRELGSTVSEQDVIAWSRRSIAGYKAPKSVDFVQAIPKNAAGKVLKRELRALYWVDEGHNI